MVVAPEGEEDSPIHGILDLHAQQVSIKADRSIQIGDLQMHVTDVSHSLTHGLHPSGTPRDEAGQQDTETAARAQAHAIQASGTPGGPALQDDART
jgi:hypothetical protein